ncbi:MAG: tetratricopeptide repeat protein, partial [Proteobacteria bacterium]|nr:tetratricopeptide repeat protein [Pseudomonadota bacterium]
MTVALAAPATACAFAQAQTPTQWVTQAEALQNKDDPAALKLVERALGDARLQGHDRSKALGLRCWLTASTAIGKVEDVSTRDLPLVERIGDAKAMSELYACRGYAREQGNDLAGAARDYDAAMAAGQRAGDAAAIAQAAVFRGEVRYEVGDTTDALADLQLAWRLQTQRGDAERANYALNAIANLYADPRVGEYDKALVYYRQLLALHEAANNPREVATAWFNIAATLDHKGDQVGAVAAYRKVLAIDVARNDVDSLAEVRRALGVSLVKLGRFDEAMALFDQSIAGFHAVSDDEGVAAARLSRAIGLRRMGRIDAANADFAAARAYFTRNANPRYLDKIEGEQALSYAAAGDWR